jgi:hypothetical protein
MAPAEKPIQSPFPGVNLLDADNLLLDGFRHELARLNARDLPGILSNADKKALNRLTVRLASSLRHQGLRQSLTPLGESF